MRFWDTSAIVPLILDEPASGATRSLLREDEGIVVWWSARVECVSALVRRRREGVIGDHGEDQCRSALSKLAESWSEMQPTAKLRSLAERSLAVHQLRSADALQLAAALRWCEGEPRGREFVCFDNRLREAARKEGFSVSPREQQ